MIISRWAGRIRGWPGVPHTLDKYIKNLYSIATLLIPHLLNVFLPERVTRREA